MASAFLTKWLRDRDKLVNKNIFDTKAKVSVNPFAPERKQTSLRFENLGTSASMTPTAGIAPPKITQQKFQAPEPELQMQTAKQTGTTPFDIKKLELPKPSKLFEWEAPEWYQKANVKATRAFSTPLQEVHLVLGTQVSLYRKE